MSPNQDLDWKQALGHARKGVVEQEEQRELEKKLQRERNENDLRKRLETDTAESFDERFQSVRQRFDQAVRKFCPIPHLASVREDRQDLTDILKFYKSCFQKFGRVFTPQHKTLIPKILSELDGMQKLLDRQTEQWAKAGAILPEVTFVPRTEEHDEALVIVAKDFSERSSGMKLSIPGDYFAKENEHFWAVETAEHVLGYVKYSPEDKLVVFALAPVGKVNFNKYVRAILHKFATEGPLEEKLDAIRVHVTCQREIKFYTDLGFIRTEIRGPADWVYERAID
jgi:hypothetical protein